MARIVKERLVVEGELVACSALHAGAAEEDLVTDLPLARTGANEVYIPGTGLAGALRSWVERRFGREDAIALFGTVPRKGEDSRKGFASLIGIADAVALDQAFCEVRDGVGIDRRLGRAAERIKYDREIVAKGTRFSFAMTLDLPLAFAGQPERAVGERPDRSKVIEQLVALNESRVQAILGHLVKHLVDGRIALGAGKTRGLGSVRLEKVKISRLKLADRTAVLDLLDGKESPAVCADDLVNKDIGAAPKQLPELEITIKWKPRTPILVKADVEGLGVDMIPLFSGNDGELSPVIPGSSVKGAIRARAEAIAATALEIACEPGTNFLHQKARVPLIEFLFGAPGRSVGEGSKTGLAALAIADTYASVTIGADQFAGLLAAGADADGPGALGRTRREIDGILSGMAPEPHVAIDRWLGGAADGLLFSVLEPRAVEWPGQISVALDCARLQCSCDSESEPACTPLAALAPLLLALSELARGEIALGHGGTRGLGEIAVSEITFAWATDGRWDDIADVDTLRIDAGGLHGAPRAIARIKEDWGRYQRLCAEGPAA